MFCKQCGEGIDTPVNFCPNCGQKLINDAKKIQTAAPQKRSQFWLKALFSCVFGIAAFAIYLAITVAEPSETVENQLQAVRDQRITEAYYRYTSKGFQETVSMDQFRQFIRTNPIFAQSTDVHFLALKNDDDKSTIEAVISDAKGADLKVQYRLIKEGSTWKILSLKAVDVVTGGQTAENTDSKVESSPLKTEPFDSQPLLDVIQEQLALIRKNDLEKAYKNTTSADFQKETTLQAFTDFVLGHPGFMDNASVNMGRVAAIDNNVVTISGTLTSNSGHSYGVDYNLISEDGKWKILHIEVTRETAKAPKSVMQPGALVFDKFVLGTKIDNSGLVTNPTQEFTKDAGEIHLNLFTKNAVTGTEVEVIFQHMESNSKAPPIKAIIPDEGDEVLSFAFSPPPNGWPSGKYSIQAKSSTGIVGSVDFKVK